MDEFIISCSHVVDGDTAIITDIKGISQKAWVVGRNKEKDIVVLRTAKDLIVSYETRGVAIKDEVEIIGNPGGLGWSHIIGRVQGLDRVGEDGIPFIQIGASSYYGSSGSPVICEGKLVGMVRAFNPHAGVTMATPIQYILLFIKGIDP
jgi:serine protease Do